MATSLERLDQIRDALIGQGLGTSRLAQQKIERQNLADLSSSLGESRATRAQQQKTRIQEIQGRIGRQTIPRIGRGGGRSQFDPNAPQAVVVATKGFKAGTKERFGITTRVGGTGQRKTQGFESIGELQAAIKDLQKRGTQIVIPGTQEGFSIKDLKQLRNLGAIQRSDQATVTSFLGRPRKSVAAAKKSFSGKGFGQRGIGTQAIEDADRQTSEQEKFKEGKGRIRTTGRAGTIGLTGRTTGDVTGRRKSFAESLSTPELERIIEQRDILGQSTKSLEAELDKRLGQEQLNKQRTRSNIPFDFRSLFTGGTGRAVRQRGIQSLLDLF